jgi:hypothetical protein
VRLRRKQQIKVSKKEEEIVFSIVCACAETADQGLKNEEETVFSIVLHSLFLLI